MRFIAQSFTRLARRRTFDWATSEADAARDKRQWAKAAELYGEAVGLDGNKSWAWVQYAHALKESGAVTLAIDAYERAIELSPDDVDPVLHLSHLLKRLGDKRAIERFRQLRELTGDRSIDEEVDRLIAFHGGTTGEAENASGTAREAARAQAAFPGVAISRTAQPTSPEPGLHARRRGVRFVALDRSGRRRHKLRLCVDDALVWSGFATAKTVQADCITFFDFSLSFPEPSCPTTVRRVVVEAATVGLEPAGGTIELPYAARFTGQVRVIDRTPTGCTIVASFVDSEGLTTKPFVRATAPDGSEVQTLPLRTTIRSNETGSVELECHAKVTCSADQINKLVFYPMWSTVALLPHASAQGRDRDSHLVVADDFQMAGPPQLRLDWVRRGLVGGWALLPTAPDAKLVVDVLHGDQILGSGVASRHRPDIAAVFGTNGNHAYEIEIGPGLPEGLPLKARVRSPDEIVETAPRSAPASARGILKHQSTLGGWLSSLIEEPLLASSEFQPSVAAIVLNRNGADLLSKLFQSIVERNTYLNFEIIVVDHESTDNSEQACREFSGRLNIKFIPRGFNGSFSASNNYGASQTQADLVFFLNNDTVFVEDILPNLVSQFQRDDVGAVGVRLIDRWSDYLDGLVAEPADQHLGVFFRDSSGQPKMYELRGGPIANDIKRELIRTPAVTAAALLMRRIDFLELGGFDERYFYGQEDVDLCIRLGEAGRTILCDNRMSLAHLRGFTRTQEGQRDNEFARSQARNRELLNRVHARSVHRQFRSNLLARTHLTAASVQIVFIVTSVVSDTLAGDVFTAQELSKALADALPKCEFRFVAPDSDRKIDVEGADIIICMRDDFDIREYINLSTTCHVIFWIRNNFDRFLDSENWQYCDDVWFSSERELSRFERSSGLPAKLLRIATNFAHFSEAIPDPDYKCDYCFTGTRWGLHREISVSLVPEAINGTFRVFGAGWDKDSAFSPYAFGSLRYSEMARVYASSRIVIDDANHVTVESGSVNSRVFDAIAAGALPLTNGLIGAQEAFGGTLPTYSSAQELQSILSSYLADEEARLAKVEELRSIVERDHTYARRAQDVVNFIRQAEKREPSVAIKIAAPRRETRDEWGDFHYAEALRYSLARLGIRSGIFLLNEWDSVRACAADVSLVLRGLNRAKVHPHQLNLQWIISHPDKVSLDECRAFDHVFAASEKLVEDFLSRGIDASLALQCTDTRRFRPDVEPLVDAPDVLFVGNSRGVMRPIVLDAIAAGLDLHVYGEGWTGLIPSKFVRATHIPNGQLPRWYASAGVVLNDHWPSMAEADLVSNRVFDVLAAGGRCISDENAGIAPVFGEAVQCYSDPIDLRKRVDRILHARRNGGAARLKVADMIAREHSFDRRAAQIANVIKERMQTPPADLNAARQRPTIRVNGNRRAEK